jgi:oligoendopeptidase F
LKESNGEKVKDEFKNFHDEFKSHPPHVQTKITSNLRKGMSYRKAIDTAKKLKESNGEKVKDEFKNFHDEFKSHPPHVQAKITSNLRKGMSYRKAIDTAKKLKEEQIEEREMTAADKKREEKLKSKYDDSGMKASMIKQYGDEKGKKVYFAYIRKKAMKSEQADTAISTSSGNVGDTGRV